MRIATGWSTHSNPERAAAIAYEMLVGKLQGTPQLMLAHSSCAYDNEVLVRHLFKLAPGIPLQGGTSCLGVMTEDGWHSQDGLGLGILGILDPDGSYGAGMAECKSDPETAATSALIQALAQASRPGELPAAIVITCPPGHEEKLIGAIENYLGVHVPIVGGTSADNDMSGKWQQFGNDRVERDAVSVAALFPTANIGHSFHSGYEPTEHRGRATRTDGRILYEIDGRPAAQVYNEWTGGLISNVLEQGGSLVPTATFTPFGNPVGRVGNVPYYRLSYPVAVLADRALLLFTDIRTGHELVLMRGTKESLATRGGRVAATALAAAPFTAEEVQGSLVLFCTGCMLAIRDRLEETLASLRTALHNTPFLCVFTLGEQGCFIGGENRHGNLMVATLAFGPIKEE